MYKFTNGIVVFDKETRDAYIKAGMVLVKEEKVEDTKKVDLFPNKEGNGETRSSIKKDRKWIREEY